MKQSSAVLAVWNDIDVEVEDEFNDWYQRDHLPDRLSVPGFIDARRGVALSGRPKYCAFYALESLDVLRSQRYLDRLAEPTTGTTRLMPHFRAMNRSACAVTLDQGRGTGGVVVSAALSPVPGAADELRRALADEVFPALLHLPGLLRMQLWEADSALSTLRTREQSLRPAPDQAADWVIVADCLRVSDAAPVGPGLADLLHEAGSVAGTSTAATYRLMCHLTAR